MISLLKKILNHPFNVEKDVDITTISIHKDNILDVMWILKKNPSFLFTQLSDLCAVDYSSFGESEWKTDDPTTTGYNRGITPKSHGRIKFGDDVDIHKKKDRYCVVYHLLSLEKNIRLRVKVFLTEDDITLPSVVEVWSCADWYEREAFDLFGILFIGHPDLRRLLTDYGFIGHPFRKDFPLVGNTQVRYDSILKKIIHEPVDIDPRVLVPRVIREKE
tara:strand:- start:40 stop:693 length:654 start_codon:yes stop_codon:yes gene_type:complete